MTLHNRLARIFAPRPRLCDAALAELAELVTTPTIADLANDPAVDLAEAPPKIRAAVMLARAAAAARAGSISPDETAVAIAAALRVAQGTR
jgi:hypothetical protein